MPSIQPEILRMPPAAKANFKKGSNSTLMLTTKTLMRRFEAKDLGKAKSQVYPDQPSIYPTKPQGKRTSRYACKKE